MKNAGIISVIFLVLSGQFASYGASGSLLSGRDVAEIADSTDIADVADVAEKKDSIGQSVVSAGRKHRVMDGLMSGNFRFDTENISVLPKFLGNTDVLKTLQLLPGIQTSGEMDSGIYIRGGDPGQNLIMLDGATVYAPSHLLGFFSVFNSDHIASATLLKSGMSAKYGSCTSGVIDIGTGDEISESISGTTNIGLISAQQTICVPFAGHHQLTASARVTYVNEIIDLAMGDGSDLKYDPEYGFQDYNLTWLSKWKDNTLKINGFYGRDRFGLYHRGYSVTSEMLWSNLATSVVFEHDPIDGLRQKHTANFTRYSKDISIERFSADMKMPSSIMDAAYKGEATVRLRYGRLDFGANYTYHNTNVQYPIIHGLNTGIDNIQGPAPYHTHEFGLFADWQFWFNFPLSVDIGLRYSGAVTADQFYHGPEPRLSISYNPLPNLRLRASAGIQRQYMNMVPVSGMGMPTDFWVPVSSDVRPQISKSFSISLSHSLAGGLFEYSIEPYFAKHHNVLEYDGELFDMMNQRYDVEEHLLAGKGRNYGVEFMLKKNGRIINGWISYTLGRAERSFPDIMGGAVFPAKHDRRHNLSAVLSYCPTNRWEFSTVFVYATGTAYTPPVGVYIVGENLIQEYGDYNSARMPDYNRLDISATYNFNPDARFRHSLNISVYNVYARKNPLYRELYLTSSTEDENLLRFGVSAPSMYSIVPSISYIFKF